LFNAYGYSLERGGVDLKPGVRLKVERAYFRPGEAGEDPHAAKNFAGVSTMYASVELTGDSKVRYQHVGETLYSPASLAHTDDDANRDLRLIGVPEEPYYRLLFYTYVVPKDRTLSAVIIGASSASQLDRLDKELRAQPHAGCKSAVAAAGMACFEFDGFVTLSCQIEVVVNGTRKFVEWGARVKDVVPAKSLKALRMQRRYLDSYYDVRFDPRDADVLSLVLVDGDRLSWSGGVATAH
jgi:hypothetical protein